MLSSLSPLLAFFVLTSSPLAQQGVVLHVKLASQTLGQDVARNVHGAATTRDGSLAYPYSHPEEAIDAMYDLRQQERTANKTPQPITIQIGDGAWFLQRPLRFDSNSTGTPQAKTTLRGNGQNTRLIGGRILPPSAFQKLTDPAILERLPNAEARRSVRVVDLEILGIETLEPPQPRGMGGPVAAVPSELFFDGQALTPARWPNDDFIRVSKVIDSGSIPRQRRDDIPLAERETGPARGGVFAFDAEHLKRWSSAPDPWMCGYWHWDWADQLLPVAKIDVEAGLVHLRLPHTYGLRDGARFFITNLLEELDIAGEYYIDIAAKRLYLWPPEANLAPSHEIILSLLAEPLVQMQGSSHIAIENLVIEGTRGIGVQIDGGDHVRIDGCTLRNIGTHGLDTSGRCHTVSHCTLHALGAAGVMLNGGNRQTLTASGNRVEDCEIHHFGRTWRTYQPAVSIRGVGNSVSHNHIHHAPHTAILFGGNDNQIAGNRIHDVMLETGDCGAIYAGRDWTTHGNMIRNNLIHDLPGSEHRWQNGVYLDDMASGIAVEGNIFYRCNLGMLVGGGRHLSIRNNLFLDSDLGIRFDARGVGWMAGHIADPTTSTLHRGLAAMPIHQPPWSIRFPELQNTLTEDFGRPLGSAVVGNAFVRTNFGNVQDRELVLVEDNLISTLDPNLFATTPTTEQRDFDFASATWTHPDVKGFLPIPVASFGVRARDINLLHKCPPNLASNGPLGLATSGKGAWQFYPAAQTDPQLPRVLLIGDSITNGYRSAVARELNGIASVDTWLTPAAENDPGLLPDLQRVLAQGPYAVVHFNIGLHGWPQGRIAVGTYLPLMQDYLATLRRHAPRAKFIWASSTPITVLKQPTKLDPANNATISGRNTVTVDLMSAAGLQVNDLYNLVIDKLNLAKGDRFHWQAPAYELMGKQTAGCILAEL